MPIIAIIATAVSELPVWLCQPLWSLAMPALFVTTLSACSVGYASHCAVFVVGYAGQLLLAMPITAEASVVLVGRYVHATTVWLVFAALASVMYACVIIVHAITVWLPWLLSMPAST